MERYEQKCDHCGSNNMFRLDEDGEDRNGDCWCDGCARCFIECKLCNESVCDDKCQSREYRNYCRWCVDGNVDFEPIKKKLDAEKAEYLKQRGKEKKRLKKFGVLKEKRGRRKDFRGRLLTGMFKLALGMENKD